MQEIKCNESHNMTQLFKKKKEKKYLHIYMHKHKILILLQIVIKYIERMNKDKMNIDGCIREPNSHLP